MNNAMLLQDAMGLVDEAIVDKAANTYASKRHSRWPGVVAAVAAILALVIFGASMIRPSEIVLDADYYKIRKADGIYVMNTGLPGLGYGSLSESRPPELIKFESLADMRRIIFGGQLSDRAVRISKSFKRAKRGGILLFDPNNMQDIVVPEDMFVDGLIIWQGYCYSFSFGNDALGGSLYYSCIDGSQNLAEKEIQIEEHGVTILSVTHDAKRNATETVFQAVSSQHVWKQIVYTVTEGTKTVTFVENYWDSAKQEVPNRIIFWGTVDGNFFHGNLFGMKERPSLEYLMQFGLKPFVEE
jgi:hypothetical protein